jgi:hypothetical protein
MNNIVDYTKQYDNKNSPKKKYYHFIENKNETSLIKKIVLKTGSIYEGHLNQRDERHGFGIYKVVFGVRYEGNWINGIKEGFGKFFDKNEILIYEGDWKKRVYHGKKILRNNKGEIVHQGKFRNGKIVKNSN